MFIFELYLDPEETKAASIGAEIPIVILSNPAEPTYSFVPTSEAGGLEINPIIFIVGIAGVAILLVGVFLIKNKKKIVMEPEVKAEQEIIPAEAPPHIKESVKTNQNKHSIKVKRHGNG